MAIALIANTGATSGDTKVVTTTAINTTGASLLVVVVAQWQNRTLGTVSDSKSNSGWTALTSQATAGAARETIFYCPNATVGTNHTFTYTSASSLDDYPAICVAAFSNVKTASPLDQQTGSTTVAATIQPGSVTPTENNELVVSGLGFSPAPNSWSIDSSFTITNQKDYHADGNSSFGVACAYLVQTTAGAANETWTASGAFVSGTNATFQLSTAASPRLALLGVG